MDVINFSIISNHCLSLSQIIFEVEYNSLNYVIEVISYKKNKTNNHKSIGLGHQHIAGCYKFQNRVSISRYNEKFNNV